TAREAPNRHAVSRGNSKLIGDALLGQAGVWAHPAWCPLMPEGGGGGERASSASTTSNRTSTASTSSDKLTQGYYL
ncbi:hypothetical protein Pmar_PMAR024837, partial [Perkinsus marinus ATCC 50983]